MFHRSLRLQYVGTRHAVNCARDGGFMYNRNLADLDGHVRDAMWMQRNKGQVA